MPRRLVDIDNIINYTPKTPLAAAEILIADGKGKAREYRVPTICS